MHQAYEEITELLHALDNLSWRIVTKNPNKFIDPKRLPPHPQVKEHAGDYIRAKLVDPELMDKETVDAFYQYIYLSHYTEVIPEDVRFRFRGESTRTLCSSPRRAPPPSSATRTSKTPKSRKTSKASKKDKAAVPAPAESSDSDEGFSILPTALSRSSLQPEAKRKANNVQSPGTKVQRLSNLPVDSDEEGEDFAGEMDAVHSDSSTPEQVNDSVAGRFLYLRLDLPSPMRNPAYDPKKVSSYPILMRHSHLTTVFQPIVSEKI